LDAKIIPHDFLTIIYSRVAVVMKFGGLSPGESVERLRENGGYLKKTLGSIPRGTGNP